MCKVLEDSGSICWQVGNYVSNGEVFPLDVFYYKMFKDQGMYLRIELSGDMDTGYMQRKDFLDDMKLSYGFQNRMNIHLTWIQLQFRLKYPGKKYSKGPKKGKSFWKPEGKNSF